MGNENMQNFTAYPSTQSNFPEINPDKHNTLKSNLIGVKKYPRTRKQFNFP